MPLNNAYNNIQEGNMLKQFILTLALFSTLRTFAMRHFPMGPRIVYRGGGIMTAAQRAQLMENQKGLPLPPKEFAARLAQTTKNIDDLLWLYQEHAKEIDSYYPRPLLDDMRDDHGDLQDRLPFFKQDSISNKISSYLRGTALVTCVLGIPLTLGAATGSIVGELALLVAKNSDLIEMVDMVQRIASSAESLTVWSGAATAGGGAIAFLPELEEIKVRLKPYGHYARMHKRVLANFKHIEDLLEQECAKEVADFNAKLRDACAYKKECDAKHD